MVYSNHQQNKDIKKIIRCQASLYISTIKDLYPSFDVYCLSTFSYSTIEMLSKLFLIFFFINSNVTALLYIIK